MPQVVECSVHGCHRERTSRGMCPMHYERVKRDGEPGEVAARPIGGPTGLRVHGVNGYKRWGCRCNTCTDAMKRKMAVDHARAMAVRKGDHGSRDSAIRKHGATGYWKGCRCDVCREAHVAKLPESNQKSNQKVKSVNGKTLEQATRYGYVWTGPEIELAARSDLSARQVAEMTGRTLFAVWNIRKKISEEDPRTMELLGR